MRYRVAPLGVLLLLLTAIVVGASCVHRHAVQGVDRRKDAADAQELRSAQHQLSQALQGLRQLQLTGRQLDLEKLRQKFPDFSTLTRADPITTGVFLEQAVQDVDRAAFERRAGVRIAVRRSGAPRRPRGRAAQYLVVVGGRSETTTSSASRGLDVLADSQRAPVIARAAATGLPQATAAVAGLAQRARTVVVYAPLGPRRGSALPNFVAAAFSVDAIAHNLLSGLSPGTELLVTDGTHRLAGRAPHDPGARGTSSFAGRRWTITVSTQRPPVPAGWVGVVLLGAVLAGALACSMLWGERRFGDVRQQRDDARARLDSAFRGAPIGMVVVDLHGRILDVNAAFGTLTGMAIQDALGADALELAHPEDRDALRASAADLVTGRTDRISADRRIVARDGRTRWVRVDATLVEAGDATARELLVQVQDVDARRRHEAQLQHMADHDPLTGLFNRRAFELLLERHVLRGRRYGHRGALMVLDLDGFKAINDTLGHHVGDRLIVGVARALEDRLRESDIIARLGGDEFAVLLPEVGRDDVERVAGDLLRVIREVRVHGQDAARPRGTSASIGIVLIEHTAATGADDLLVSADLAMYDAKEAGRDRIDVYTEDPSALTGTGTQGQVTWSQHLRDALAEDRFTLWAQPIVDLAGGEATQHEVLLRYIAPDGELVGPQAFLPAAERFGLMTDIDAWVVRRAIAELARRAAPVVFEVNLSGGSLGNPALLDLIESELDRTQVDPARLIFEVTETTAVQNIPRARAFAERLEEIGCRFALDDFGAGYGSFYYLKHLPFDLVKIDGEFVRNAVEGEVDQLVIEAVVGIARGMAKTTVAEHVGDEATVTLLRELGVDLGQGYHLGRPAPLDEVLPPLELAARV